MSYKKTILNLFGVMFFLLSAVCTPLRADNFNLYVGDIQILNLGKITRVAVGNGGLISTSILENGSLLVLAEKEGDTELQIWLDNGNRVTHKLYITKVDSNRTSSEITSVLRNMPGITIRKVGGNTVIEGSVAEETSSLLEKVASKYSDLINLTTVSGLSDISELLSSLTGLKIRQIGKYAVIEGAVDDDGKALIEGAKTAFPTILDLTSKTKLTLKPTISLNVQITEFNTNKLDELGISWDTSFPGPSLGFAKDFSHKGAASSLENQSALTVSGATLAHSQLGFFGLATFIGSTINLAVNEGDALILASPTLTAKSGGKAEFLSGGEIPIPVPGADGTVTIEFKDYGISLKVEPEAGISGNVSAKVETEISTIDDAVTVLGIPGFKTRRTLTEANLRHGETLVISGLVNNEVSKDFDKVAWLGDLPILGPLFRSESFRNNRSDLVIFITPTVIDTESTQNQAAIARAGKLRQKFFENIEEVEGILD
ncbi:MAG: hypothetical protein GY696_28875 [Gammaproteobacteria bacterium]|nr:hypothetical protein [Gammaproteobacteria bacterium]